MNFGKRLEISLQKKKMRQKWAAETLRMSDQQLSKIIKTDIQPRKVLEMAEALHTKLGVDKEWLAYGVNIETDEIEILEGNDLLPSGQKIQAPSIDQQIAFRVDRTIMLPDLEVPRGTIIIARKNKPPIDGDYVLAKNNSKSILIRKLLYTSGGYKLCALHDESTYSDKDVEIVGVIAEFRVVFP
ncbi:MAG: hypothetical protein GY814_00610 [Gammaproteobacteria bacterium]|nr:hypothetical protein [Gammaproteobacteria bacterium]